MHILFLSQIVPYPPDAGPKVKTWHVLRYLVERGHHVSLACFVRQEEEPYLPELRKHFAQVYAVPIHRSRLADLAYGLRSLVTGRPFLVERDDLSGMRTLVRQVVENEAVDVIHADQLTMAQFAYGVTRIGENNKRPYLVFDAHNAVWTIMERMVQNVPFWQKPVVALEARKIKQYEGKVVRDFDHTLAVTEIDRNALSDGALSGKKDTDFAVERKITVIPIAVDTGSQRPITHQPDSNTLLTLGTLRYPPNADGIRWFAREVFPLVQKQNPQARLIIIGKNPPGDFLQIARDSQGAVNVTGYVPNLTPYIEQSALMVIPVRAGGGMRVRILEAFAWGMPVVTTTIGLEGIEAIPGRDVLVADTPEEFAASVLHLLSDPALRDCLSKNSRALVESKYDWQVALKHLASVYSCFEPRTENEAQGKSEL